MVKKNLDAFLENVKLQAAGDDNYGRTNATWGDTLYGTMYALNNPVIDKTQEDSDILVDFPRIIAFVLKTVGDETVNGATYSTWYSRIVSAGNNWSLAGAQWKLFGQFYGWGQDAPWINSQTTLSGPSTIREPTYYSGIPGDTPDIARGSTLGKHYAVRAIINE